MKPLIFLSHASVDRVAANYFTKRLEELSGGAVRFFISSDDGSLELGDEWARKITATLRDAEFVLVFLTNAAAASAYVMFEIGFARGQGKRVIPVGIDLDVATAPGILPSRHGVTVTSAGDLNKIAERLEKILKVPFAGRFTRDDHDRMVSWTRDHGNVIKAIHLSDRARTYQEAVRLIISARDTAHIRATVSLFDPDDFDDRFFTAYLTAVAKRCGTSARLGGSFRYNAIFGFHRTDETDIPADVKSTLRDRIKIFERYRAMSRVSFFEIGAKWSLNVLIVDYDDAIIGFPESAHHTKLQDSVHLSGVNVVSPIAQWYDKCVQGQAVQIDLSTL